MIRAVLCVLLLSCMAHGARAGVSARAGGGEHAGAEKLASVAVLDFAGDEATGALAAAELSRLFDSDGRFEFVDRGLTRAAARGAGYTGSVNLARAQARDLGRSIGCDYYFAGRAETVRRSSSSRDVYFEAYAGVFLVSTRDGGLARFDLVSAEADTPDRAREALRRSLAAAAARCADALRRTRAEELDGARRANTASVGDAEEVEDFSGDDAPGGEGDVVSGVRLPYPYRRLRPVYTDEAARAGVEATVDARVTIDAEGEVAAVEIDRWAGFGLDEAVARAIRAMHFRPAVRVRTGEAVPVRVLLRYNFRRTPPK